MQRQDSFKLLVITAIFFAALGAASFISVKTGMIFGLIFAVGAIPYALTFPCVDIVCETRGRLQAYKLVAAGLVAHLAAMVFTIIALAIPAENVWAPAAGQSPTAMAEYMEINRHLLFDELFTAGPQLLAAGFVAYLITQLLNVHLFDAIRRMTKGKMLWLRNSVSTGLCQLIDTIIFVPLAFATQVSTSDLPVIIAGQFAIKLAIAVLDTPLVYLGVRWMGGRRGDDLADAETGAGGAAADGSVAEAKPVSFDPESPTGPLPKSSEANAGAGSDG